MQRTIPFFNYPALFVPQEEDFMTLLRDVMRRGAFIMQKDLREFESNLASFIGVKHALGVADGTMALVIALKAAGIQPGDEVIAPSHTFVASIAAIHEVGAKPILVECQADHLIDPTSVAAAITPRTRGIMPVHLNGRTCNMDALQTLADEYNLLIVEDAAQALGSNYKGQFAGTFGAAGIFSFYPAKLLGCFGDGGAVVTNDDRVAEQVVLLRDHGRNEAGEVITWGFNARLDNLQAAVLDFKLKTFSKDIQRRREIAARYHNALSEISDLVLPPAPNEDLNHFDVYQNYEIESGQRDELRAYLKEAGIGTIIQWAGKAVHQFEKLGFNVELPFTEKMFTRCFMLPMNTSLSDEDVDYICQTIRKFYGYN